LKAAVDAVEIELSRFSSNSKGVSTTMGDDKVVLLRSQSEIEDPLTELLREKASELLQAAVQAECEVFLARFTGRRDDQGR